MGGRGYSNLCTQLCVSLHGLGHHQAGPRARLDQDTTGRAGGHPEAAGV